MIKLIKQPFTYYYNYIDIITHMYRYSDPVIQGQLANGSLAAAANGANGQPNPGNPNADDLTPDYMNVLGMIFSMCALMMRMK